MSGTQRDLNGLEKSTVFSTYLSGLIAVRNWVPQRSRSIFVFVQPAQSLLWGLLTIINSY